MAAIDEGDKVRTIYDGSWAGANTHIQNNTMERITAPTVLDCVQAIQWLRITPAPEGTSAIGDEPQGWAPPDPQEELLLLKADVTKAHRRVKVLPQDWRFQVAQINDQWWINKVGAYGVASAQLYWGRLAALLLRLIYNKMVPSVDWRFIFVDDFCWILRQRSAHRRATLLLALLLALGTPLSWKKTKLALINLWLGFNIDPKGPIVTMGPEKHELVVQLLQRLAKGECFSSKKIERALGRIRWATTIRPFNHSGLGRLPARPKDALVRPSDTFAISFWLSLRNFSFTLHPTLHILSGGVRAMPVRQGMVRLTSGAGLQTLKIQPRPKFAGSNSGWIQQYILGPSKMETRAGVLPPWKCWEL